MYLKRLELVGFKSFADKTRLDFEPGIMAIVGPNGCGKSNIADAVRWVLGEQSAKALRGAKMEDCIFNGADARKALGMAEVSLTLADCESTLGTEYNEVTVTRRVFRSGEGQYLINKTPCRLKDIQRLFMDTGIGTSSYSLMEQGRIDRILSSRPGDRRSVFEEASGITKFKADKKEAIRKLDHTEANLLRLADIIREVKRQIVSLQRQAGKARRYQALRDRLRGYELYFTRDGLQHLDEEISTLGTRRAGLAEREDAARVEVEEAETRIHALRDERAALEQEIEETRESMLQAQAEWERTRETIQVNDARIAELTDFSARDTREAEQSRASLEAHRAECGQMATRAEEATAARAAAEAALAEKTAHLKECEDRIEENALLRHRLRTEQLEDETRLSNLQQELADLDARDRTATLRRERLGAERAGLQRTLEQYDERLDEMAGRLEELRTEAATLDRAREELDAQLRDRTRAIGETRQALSAERERLAGRRAEKAVLEQGERKAEGFPGGARLLLAKADAPGGPDRTAVLGALAAHLEVDPDYRPALEAVLRPWLDAVLVRDAEAARDLLAELHQRRAGSARLLPAPAAPHRPAAGDAPGEALLAHLRVPGAGAGAIERLLANVRVVASLEDIPRPAPDGWVFVSIAGHLVEGNARFEYWMPDPAETNPVARVQALRACTEEIATLEGGIESLATRLEALQSDDDAAAAERARLAGRLADARRALALAEGEDRVLQRDAGEARQRVETVGFELDALLEQGSSSEDRRAGVHAAIEELQARQAERRQALTEQNERQQREETERSRWLGEVTEARVAAADRRRDVETLEQRLAQQQARIAELETLIRERSEGLTTYRARIEELHRETAAARDSLQPMQDEVNLHKERLESERRRRDEQQRLVAETEQTMQQRRDLLEQLRRALGETDVQLAEQKLRRQNLLERVGADYRVSAEDIRSAPEPDWGEAESAPDRETIEASIAEMRARLESMGPVNLVAIEEYQELEKRYAFLTGQQGDLVRSKQQLMDMIRRINRTTTELFSETFNKVNTNFQDMFQRLFGGGTAKLVLVDEEDVLESGIEIIARPPGKKLQAVSLLSGGERTMTAVALLFALYLVKPSPFCVLDELDAALDEANIGRFVDVVTEFVRQSQFVVITHNRRTIAAARALFGVTMEQQGISRIVSVRFRPDGELEPAGEPA